MKDACLPVGGLTIYIHVYDDSGLYRDACEWKLTTCTYVCGGNIHYTCIFMRVGGITLYILYGYEDPQFGREGKA